MSLYYLCMQVKQPMKIRSGDKTISWNVSKLSPRLNHGGMSVYSLAYVPCAVEHGCVGAGTTLVTQHHQDCRVLYQQASHFSSAPHYSDYSITSLLQPYCFALRCSPFPVATRGAEFCEVVCHMILTWQYPASHVWNRQRALSQKERNCRLIISQREREKNGGDDETRKRPGLQAIAGHRS